MSIVIHNPSFSHFMRDRRSAEVNGKTIGECLADLIRQFPEMQKVLFDECGNLQSHVCVCVNSEVSYCPELTRLVKEGDELHLLLVYGGG